MNSSDSRPSPLSAIKSKPTESPRPESDASFPVVGIGASAGGLEAIRELFKHLPADTGMAFVLISHLSPQHHSALAELISRSTAMEVSEVTDGMAVEPNRVYVIPANAAMTVSEGILHLEHRSESGVHMPIDLFLKSLAEGERGMAFSIILSGTGSDGALGTGAIKANGGITFAQEAQTAKYDGMPSSAIASGNVDLVLSPEGIAHELVRIARDFHRVGHHVAKPVSERRKQTEEVLAVVRNATGVDFTNYKHGTIDRRLRRRVLLRKADGLADYLEYLQGDPRETSALYQDLLINVTSFFRDPEAFEALKSEVFPRIMQSRSPEVPIRIWVPGCSGGEETYSLAIVLMEFLGAKSSSIPVQLYGTDLGEKSIDKARAGFYTENEVVPVSPERLASFFTKARGGYQISKRIRDICVFSRQNIFADPPFSQMDLISCRNVLIYMEQDLQQRIVPILHYALKPEGFLFLGSSEGIGRFSDLFEVADKKHKLYKKKWAAERPYLVKFPTRPTKVLPHPRTIRDDSGPENELQREFDRQLLASYPQAAVVIDGDAYVLQSRGDTSPFLRLPPGRASLNLLKMAREGLFYDLRSAINKVKKNKEPVRREGLQVKHNRNYKTVSFEVSPLQPPSGGSACCMVVFKDETPLLQSGTPAGLPSPKTKTLGKTQGKRAGGSDAARVIALERELAAVKEHLQSTIEAHEASGEELQSATEEILSSNEELQSTNEELETAKEELQSGNEELNTLNDELRYRNADLSERSSDLANLLEAIRIPIVFVGADLRVRRLTSTATGAFRVIPSDVGRPIADIRHNLAIPNLEALIRQAIDDLTTTERELQDTDGRWFSLQIRPYRTGENKIEGAVLSLLDIDAVKRNERHLKIIIESVPESLVVLDGELRVLLANNAFCETFKVTQDHTLNYPLYRLGNGQWNIKQLRGLLEEVLPKNMQVTGYEVEHNFPDIGHKWMSVNARQIEDSSRPGQKLILLAIEDITSRKRAEEAIRASDRLVSAGRMAATIAHEINNPLDALGNLIHLLSANELDEPARNLVKLAQVEMQRVSHITRQTLGLYSKSDKVEDVKVASVLDAILQPIAEQLKVKDVSVDKRFENASTIHAAPTEITQVFTNLILNAFAALGRGGKIALHVYNSRDWRNLARAGVRIVVADSGSGIRPEDRERIFDAFFTTKNEKGTGLGLWVTRGLVQKYGGKIRLRTSINQGRTGTCFSVFFPSAAEAPWETQRAGWSRPE